MSTETVETANVPVTKDFVLGGKAIFTIHNGKGVHYTYRVTFSKAKPDSKYGDTYFVYLLTGPDNTRNYTYAGILGKDGTYRATRQSRLNADSPSMKVFQWAINLLWHNQSFPSGYGCHSEGRCARCGRPLTDEPGVNPQGSRFGFGPKCWMVLKGKDYV